MFKSARIELTAWYLLIITFVSILFSLAIYDNVSHQIEGLIRMQNDRLKQFELQPRRDLFPPPNLPPMISTADLQNQERQLIVSLVLINLGVIIFSGGAGYFLAGRTLTPIKKMVDEQSRFISDASHELRTPIATLRAEMESTLLDRHISDLHARKLIRSNLEETDSLQKLVNRLLQITKIHQAHQPELLADVPLTEIIGAAVKKIVPLARQKHIAIDIQISESVITGNRENLVKIFSILLDNAVKYSPSDTVIRISSQLLSGKVSLAIADQGIGVPENDLPHIFERFYRSDKSRSLIDGFGLGLSIAKQMVLEHHGTIAVASLPGKGSVFTVTFPLKK
jgi:two-component system, OmpR family, sensor histidine kinase CiaH